jgi:cell division transport system ATP-binding protein
VETTGNNSERRLIDYRHVTVNQQELCILENIDFHLDAGEFVYLIGKVGSGKTSLLRTFYSELALHDGEAWVLGHNMLTIKRKHIPALRRKLGIVFQDFQLLIDRTVTENLDFVLRATGWKNKLARENRINEVLELVGMSTKGYKLPHQLSGGEQQRIVIARAILNNPEIILADEPTGNLDIETSRHIVELLRDISSRGTAVVMTTHNLQLLQEYPGIVYRCDKHQIEDVTGEYNVIAQEASFQPENS